MCNRTKTGTVASSSVENGNWNGKVAPRIKINIIPVHII